MLIPQEQIDQANETDLVSFLQSQGEKLDREGKNYRWNKHVLITGNKWIQYSPTKISGYPIKFVETFYGLPFRDAVDLLLGSGQVLRVTAAEQKKPKKQFRLPEPDSNNYHVIQYLTGRGVSSAVIQYFIDRGDLFQEKGRFPNCVFVGRDSSGKARYCFKRGTQDFVYNGKEYKFRNEPEGSDKRFSFSRAGTNNKLCIFESCIDLLSFMTLFPESRETHLLSLGGLGDEALRQYIKDHPEVNVLFFCVDADPAGDEAYNRLKHSFPPSFKVGRLIPTHFKDWNELLQHFGTVPKPEEILDS